METAVLKQAETYETTELVDRALTELMRMKMQSTQRPQQCLTK
jgi:hypothetical protein